MSRPVRVLVVLVGMPPRLGSLVPDAVGGHLATLRSLLDGAPARVALPDGVDLWCRRDPEGLDVNRRIPASAPELPVWFEDGDRMPDADDPDAREVRGDFVLARCGEDGALTDLTEREVERWALWLEVDGLPRGGQP